MTKRVWAERKQAVRVMPLFFFEERDEPAGK